MNNNLAITSEFDTASVIPSPAPPPPAAPGNSTDATRGQPLVQRCITRRAELAQALLDLDPADSLLREYLELALAGIDTMLTGDLGNVPAVVAADMNMWLEHNKHLAERTPSVKPVA